MPELDVFDTPLSQQVFLIGTIVFIALYAGGILFLRGQAVGGDRVTLHGRAAGFALFVTAAVAAAAGGLGLFNPSHGSAGQTATMSIGALQRTVDTKALPVQQVENPF